MDNETLDPIVEALLFAASPDPLTPLKMQHAFDEEAQPTVAEIEAALARLTESYASRAIHLQLSLIHI